MIAKCVICKVSHYAISSICLVWKQAIILPYSRKDEWTIMELKRQHVPKKHGRREKSST